MRSTIKMVLKDGKEGSQKVVIVYNSLEPYEVESMVAYIEANYGDSLTVIDRRKPQ